MELKGLKKLKIHIDLANITPVLSDADELNNFFSALDSLCRIIASGYVTQVNRIVYFEGGFKSSNFQYSSSQLGKLPPLLLRFEGAFNRLSNINDYKNLLPNFIISLFELRGYETRIPPKEAEQMIPDEILITKDDTFHAVVSDDKARDTTICKVRVVHSKKRAEVVLNLGTAEKVYSLEELAESNYLICWLYRKIKMTDERECISLRRTLPSFKTSSFEEVDLSTDFENFTTNDLRRFILYLVTNDDDRLSRFLNVVDKDTRLCKFIETVINRLSNEKHLLMNLWGRLRLHQETESILSLKELDIYFIRNLTDEQANFLRLEHELRDREIEISQLRRIKGSAEQLRSRISELQREIEGIYALERELIKTKEELSKEREREKTLKENLFKTKKEVEKIKDENRIKHEQIQKLNQDLKSLENEVKSKDILIKELQDKIDRTNEKIKELDVEINALKPELEKLENNLSKREKEHKEQANKKRELENKIFNYEREIESISKFLENSEEKISSLTENIKNLKVQKDLNEKEINEKESELKQLQKEFEELIKREKQLREEYRKIEKLQELKAMQEKIESFKRSLGEYERVMSIDERFEKIRDEFEKIKKKLNQILKESF